MGNKFTKLVKKSKDYLVDKGEGAVNYVVDKGKGAYNYVASGEALDDAKKVVGNAYNYVASGEALDDAKGASVVKNRLTDSLSHLRRLSGFNIDAII
jgi:hypothetical protein